MRLIKKERIEHQEKFTNEIKKYPFYIGITSPEEGVKFEIFNLIYDIDKEMKEVLIGLREALKEKVKDYIPNNICSEFFILITYKKHEYMICAERLGLDELGKEIKNFNCDAFLDQNLMFALDYINTNLKGSEAIVNEIEVHTNKMVRRYIMRNFTVEDSSLTRTKVKLVPELVKLLTNLKEFVTDKVTKPFEDGKQVTEVKFKFEYNDDIYTIDGHDLLGFIKDGKDYFDYLGVIENNIKEIEAMIKEQLHITNTKVLCTYYNDWDDFD